MGYPLFCRLPAAKVSPAGGDRGRQKTAVILGGTMDKAKSTLSMLIILLGTVSVVSAQSKIMAKVPFDFLISDHPFDAGRYWMWSSGDKIMVQNNDGKTVFVGITNAVSGRRVASAGQIVFHCYGTNCFLSELWTPTQEDGRRLLPSHYEHELARKHGMVAFALLEESHGR
jgi:hypothetical protein